MWLHAPRKTPTFVDVNDIAAPFRVRRWTPVATTLALVALAASLAFAGERWLDPQSLALFFVVPIVLVAIAFGVRMSLAASLLSVVALNFLFVEPRYTLVVARTQDVAALLLLASVGVVVGLIAERARTAESARLEAARERFKAELLAGVSHDLRTPLSTIIFTLQGLQRFATDQPAEERAELLNLAESEARRLADLVDTLLSSSRFEVGAAPVHLDPTSVSDLVATALRDLPAGAHISTSVSETLPLVSADPALAVRALVNVVSNAVKYGAGSVIEIAAHCQAHTVLIEIADRGPGLGVDPERLFERFVRGVAGDGRAPGLGLGLPLARAFMESQGGRLDAANRDGGGALFTLSLPCWTKVARDG